jgi:cytochrome c5
MGVKNITSIAGAFLLTSSFLLGCSDSSTEAKKPSAEPAKGTMPTVSIAGEPAKSTPTEQPAVEEKAPAETATTMEAPAETTPPAAEPASPGENIYKSACFACHATGVAGAPKFGDAALWKDRIAKGKDELVKNAITGYTGTAGVMPPKGGFAHLSDEEIAAAVEYMMQAAQ